VTLPFRVMFCAKVKKGKRKRSSVFSNFILGIFYSE
jgi:hypothetical protein